MPDLPLPETVHNLVTVIISTSPLPSHPSTIVIEAVLNSHKTHCPELVACKKIVVFDGYRVSTQARLKKGNVTQAIADGYEQYKIAVKSLLSAEEAGDVALHNVETSHFTTGGKRHLTHVTVNAQKSRDGQLMFVEPHTRIGFALGLRTALQLVTTPYIFVQQHDWAFCARVPLVEIISGMEASQHHQSHDDQHSRIPINYVNFNTRWSTNYSSRQVSNDPSLRALEKVILSTKEASMDVRTASLMSKSTPLFYWLDRPHIARTAVYRDQVFGQGHFSAGDFIEDVFGQRMITDIRSRMAAFVEEERAALSDNVAAVISTRDRACILRSGWLGCWLWENGDPASWSLVHLQGRTYMESTPDMKRRELNIHGGLTPVV